MNEHSRAIPGRKLQGRGLYTDIWPVQGPVLERKPGIGKGGSEPERATSEGKYPFIPTNTHIGEGNFADRLPQPLETH